MATPAQIATLRTLIDDTDVSAPDFSAQDLGGYVDAANGDVNAAASTVWTLKASRLAGLTDVTEGSSSRKLGSLYKQALEMASYFASGSTTATPTRVSRTRPIIRAVSYDQ